MLLDHMSDFFDPTPEQQIIVLIDVTTVRKAEKLIESCEQCDPDAELPFDALLDGVTGSDPAVTDYILESSAKCPRCFREVLEKTLIGPE
jgi:hypothetical protein